MSLNSEQIEEIKAQLREQAQNLPEDKKQQVFEQIKDLSPEAIESLVKEQQGRNSQKEEKTIFRMIVDSDIPSYKAGENKSAIAVLDINPISKAHTIIIPRKIVSNPKSLPLQSFSLAKSLAKKFETKFKATSCEIITEKKFNEVIINLIPIYDRPLNLTSQRTKGSKEELEGIAKILNPVKKQVIKIKKTTSNSPVQKINRRIP